MIQLFFPRMKEKINSTNSTEANRDILAKYFDQHILLWMFWSLFFMVYVNCQEVYFLRDVGGLDIAIAEVLEYIFLFQSFLAIGIVKILKLTEEEADALCRAIRGNKYKD
jgi:hypothetical protein